MIYGIVSLKCPCSQDSLKAFTELQNRLSPNSRLVVFDIGASTEENFLKMKQLLSPNFDFRYDPSKISVKTFGANVTPAAYILRNNNILYQSAVINPAKNPSPNFVLSAYNSILKGSKAKSKKAFGCMIEI